jgi:hypothetical protein
MCSIYIRQSTPEQVCFNQESTERRYNLKKNAQSLDWTPEWVRMLDLDLGQSGARTINGHYGARGSSPNCTIEEAQGEFTARLIEIFTTQTDFST